MIFLKEADSGSPLPWAIAFGVLVAIGAYLPDDDDPPGKPPSAHVVRLRASRDGHFYADVTANGQRLHPMVDNGSTYTVLPVVTAKLMGFDVEHLAWNSTSMTANGIARGADVRITLTIAGVTFRNVNATILRDVDSPLLGADFLNRLQSYEVSSGIMTLRL
jgi:aspartyl protease family protein